MDTVVAPDASAVKWINPSLKPGERRKVLTGIPGKTGIVYTLDRQTGEFLWATETTRQNVVSSIDPATGKYRESRGAVQQGRSKTLHLPDHSRRQGLDTGCL